MAKLSFGRVCESWLTKPKMYLLLEGSAPYGGLILAPAEGWWPTATSRWPSKGPPNDFLYSEWAYLGGVSFLTFCDSRFLDFKG